MSRIRNIKQVIVTALVAFSYCLLSSAALANTVLATYDLDSASGAALPLTSNNGEYTFSDITAAGLGTSAFSNHFYFTGWEASINPSKYLSVSISSASGNINLQQMLLSVESTENISATMHVRSSLDGFTSDIDSFTWDSDIVTNASFDLSAISDSSNSIELRFYVTTTGSGSYGIANHQVPGSGSGSEVPGLDVSFVRTIAQAVPTLGSFGFILSLASLLLLGGRARKLLS